MAKHNVYLVPFVEDDKLIALKTIIPSRKATKQYLEKNRTIMKLDADEKTSCATTRRAAARTLGTRRHLSMHKA